GALGSTVTFLTTLTIIPFIPNGWDPAAGFPAMAGEVPFLMKDIVLLAVSIYLLKQDVVRMSLSNRRPEMVLATLSLTAGVQASRLVDAHAWQIQRPLAPPAMRQASNSSPARLRSYRRSAPVTEKPYARNSAPSLLHAPAATRRTEYPKETTENSTKLATDNRSNQSLIRDTAGNVQKAGFRLRRLENVYLDVVKIIVAVPERE